MPRSSGHLVKCLTTMMSRSSQATFPSVSRFLSSDSHHPGMKILSAAEVIEALKAENRTTNGILDLERLLDIDVDHKTHPKDGETESTLTIALDQIPKPPADVRSAEKFFVDEAVERAKSGLESGLDVGTGSISLPAIRRKAAQDYQLLPETVKILYQKKHVEDVERFNREKAEWEKIMDIKISIRQMLQLIANNRVLARKLATANVSKVLSTSPMSGRVPVPRLGLKSSGKSEAIKMKVKFDALVSGIKRPMSAIECFMSRENERRERDGDVGLREEQAVTEYRNLSEIDRLMYDAMATLEKNRYKREVDEVRKKLKEGGTG